MWKSIFSLPIVLEIVHPTTLTYLMFSNDYDTLKDFNHLFKIVYQNEQKWKKDDEKMNRNYNWSPGVFPFWSLYLTINIWKLANFLHSTYPYLGSIHDNFLDSFACPCLWNSIPFRLLVICTKLHYES